MTFYSFLRRVRTYNTFISSELQFSNRLVQPPRHQRMVHIITAMSHSFQILECLLNYFINYLIHSNIDCLHVIGVD